MPVRVGHQPGILANWRTGLMPPSSPERFIAPRPSMGLERFPDGLGDFVRRPRPQFDGLVVQFFLGDRPRWYCCSALSTSAVVWSRMAALRSGTLMSEMAIVMPERGVAEAQILMWSTVSAVTLRPRCL